MSVEISLKETWYQSIFRDRQGKTIGSKFYGGLGKIEG